MCKDGASAFCLTQNSEPHVTPFTFWKVVSREQKCLFWTPFQAKTKGAFDGVMNHKKGVNTISYLKKGNKGFKFLRQMTPLSN